MKVRTSNLASNEDTAFVADNKTSRTLLGTHSSIYDALNNPELDVFHDDELAARLSPSTKEYLSDSSWHIVNSGTVPQLIGQTNQRTVSILSSTDGEEETADRESTVFVSRPVNGKVMVFETDEEDTDGNEEDAKGLSYDLSQSGVKMMSNIFIMPKLSVSDARVKVDQHIRISVLSSSQVSFRKETTDLVEYLDHKFHNTKLYLKHFVLRSRTQKNVKDFMKNSNLIFIVNDGSEIFVDCLKDVFKDFDYDAEPHIPKLTIINMITVNYFINLFELINFSKPFQIWKASSLRQEKLLNSLGNFIELECETNADEKVVKDFNKNAVTKRNSNLSVTVHEKSVYSTFFSSQKPDYKSIERSIHVELQQSSTIDIVDPLSLNANFSGLRFCISVVNNIMRNIWNISYYEGRKIINYWSISVLLGLGIGSYNYNKQLMDYIYSPTEYCSSVRMADSASEFKVFDVAINKKGYILYVTKLFESLFDRCLSITSQVFDSFMINKMENIFKDCQNAYIFICNSFSSSLYRIAFPLFAS